MKRCSFCQTTYGDDMNFCLNDGTALESAGFGSAQSAETLSFEKAGIPTRPNRNRPTDFSPVSPPKRSAAGKILFGVSVFGLLFFGGLIYGLVSVISRGNRNISRVDAPPRIETPQITPVIKTNQAVGKLKVEILNKVKDNFGDSYLKCLITNTGDAVISDPSFTLDLYDNDVKTGTLQGRSELEYLKPQQTIPVWINLFTGKKFTSARYNETDTLQVSDKDPEKLFPTLVFTNAKLTVETGISLYNNRQYQDRIFVVSGIVENQSYDNISPKLFVLYYDEQNEIVGINSTYPSSMKKGEKSAFESSISKTNSFGTPVRFEIIAVNDR